MQEIVLYVIENFGYLGVFLLILVENIFPPIPSEVILLFSGFFSSYANLSVFLLILSSTLASCAGAIILYYIGKYLNKDKIVKIIPFLKMGDIDKSYKWFNSKGNISIFWCRFIPIVRSLISIPAGFCKVFMPVFITYTFFGSMLWNTVLICVGRKLGSNWSLFLNILDKYKLIVIVLIVIFIIKKIKKR